MATAKTNRTIELAARTAQVTNLNFSPEKSGDNLVERVDMSIGFLTEGLDIDEIVNAKGNPLQLLWHKDGGVQFRELDKFEIKLTAEGLAQFGETDETMVEFPGAKLKKVAVTPMHDRKLGVTCQVRIDPAGHLEELGQMRINKECVFAFSGKGIASGKKKDDQQTLEV